MNERAAFTEEVIAACRELGPARLVLRNGLGISETFADLAALEVRDGWIHLVRPGVHLHLVVAALHAVAFHEPAEANPRAVALCGERGCPLLVIVLDQAHGAAAADQRERFDELRSRYGERCRLVSAQELGSPLGGAAAPDGAGSCSPPTAGSATWH